MFAFNTEDKTGDDFSIYMLQDGSEPEREFDNFAGWQKVVHDAAASAYDSE